MGMSGPLYSLHTALAFRVQHADADHKHSVAKMTGLATFGSWGPLPGTRPNVSSLGEPPTHRWLCLPLEREMQLNSNSSSSSQQA